MSKWQTLALEDCMEAIIDYRGKSPNKTTLGVPLITAKVVKRGRIETPDEFIAETDYDDWMSRGIPQAGDVVMTTEAPLGEVAQLDGRKVALAQRIITLRGKPGVLDQNFLKFLLQSQSVQEELLSRATGTTVVGIRQSELRKVNLTLPPHESQKYIGHILGSLDDKTELNRRMNETLEVMARAIFQSWFVDFDPVRAKASGEPAESICQRLGLTPELLALFPDSFEDSELGEIPIGWKVSPLVDLTNYLSRGVSPKYLEAGGVCVLNQKCIRDGKVSTASARRHDANQKSIVGRELELGDILVNSTGTGTLGRVAQVMALDELSIVDSHVTVVRANPAVCAPGYLGLALMRRQTEIEALGEGSTGQTELSRARLAVLKVLAPPILLMKAFDTKVKAFRQASSQNDRQSIVLANTRDALLPQLLSGYLPCTTSELISEHA